MEIQASSKIYVFLGVKAESFTCPLQQNKTVTITAKTAQDAQEIERSVLVNDAIANGHLLVDIRTAPTVENGKK